MNNTIKLTFAGGAGSVTGANFLLEDEKVKMLVDCGMFQGKRISEEKNNTSFSYNPQEVDFLFITHAHLDHVGRIPKLVQEGFKGKIISTPPTKDEAELILEDSMRVLRREAQENGEKPPYNEEDIKNTMALWEGVVYEEEVSLPNKLSARLKKTGHVLGSAMIEFSRDGKKVVFTGDIGNSPAPLLPFTQYAQGASYLVMESVYGDRNHEERELRREKLLEVIKNTIKKNGVLLIPAFSLERTQELLFEIEEMVEHGEIKPLPVFIDSPLAIKITRVYKRYESYFNKEVASLIKQGDEIFSFPKLSLTMSTEDSKEIHKKDNPKIIIAGSGMSNGGRILHHEKRFLGDESTTLLIVNYQAPGSLGRKLEEGVREVEIDNETVAVRADVRVIDGYSSHADADALLSFVEKSGDALSKVFVTMGEPRAAMTLAQKIYDELGVEAVVPKEGESVSLEI